MTELITGIDLVKTQLLVASGAKLPSPRKISNSGVTPSNAASTRKTPHIHAVSGSGKALACARRPGHRVDSHVYSGYTVPPNYDSMVAKLIAHGENRASAIARMKNALAELVVEGIKTNTALHQEILSHSAFRDGGLDIHYLERRLGLK